MVVHLHWWQVTILSVKFLAVKRAYQPKMGPHCQCLSVCNWAHHWHSANQCADCTSKLPLPGQARDSAEKVHVVIQGDLPVTASQIAKESPTWQWTISIVLKSIQHGHWPSDTSVKLSAFHKRWHELTLLDGCILWGTWAVIPIIFRRPLLQNLHTSHIGMNCMKSLACNYFWWPDLDAEIEELSCNCVECNRTSRNPSKLQSICGSCHNILGKGYM